MKDALPNVGEGRCGVGGSYIADAGKHGVIYRMCIVQENLNDFLDPMCLYECKRPTGWWCGDLGFAPYVGAVQ